MVYKKYRPLDWSHSMVLWYTFHTLPPPLLSPATPYQHDGEANMLGWDYFRSEPIIETMSPPDLSCFTPTNDIYHHKTQTQTWGANTKAKRNTPPQNHCSMTQPKFESSIFFLIWYLSLHVVIVLKLLFVWLILVV